MGQVVPLIDMLLGSRSREKMEVFYLALLPLLAEAAVTLSVCGRLVCRRPAGADAAIPTSIKSILAINLLLTLTLVSACLVEGVIVKGEAWPLRRAWGVERLMVRVNGEAGPGRSVVGGLGVERAEEDDDSLAALAAGGVWAAVVGYTGGVAYVGYGAAGGRRRRSKGRRSWALVERVVQAVDRRKWVGLGFAFLFSAGGYLPPYLPRYIEFDFEPERVDLSRLRKWAAAASVLLLLALVSLYTLAARLALYVSCCRLSLPESDHPPAATTAVPAAAAAAAAPLLSTAC